MLLSWIIGIITTVVQLFLLMLIVRAVISWVYLFNPIWQPQNLWVIRILNFIHRVTDPPLRLSARYIKPVRIGGMSIDLAYLVVFLLTYLLVDVLNRLQFAVFYTHHLPGL